MMINMTPFWIRGLAISLVLHLFLILFFYLWTFSKPETDLGNSISSLWKVQTDFKIENIIISPSPDINNQTKISEQLEPSLFNLSEKTNDILLPDLKAISHESLTSITGANESGVNNVGDGSGNPFFGIRTKGKKFIYVVDCSQSMIHSHSEQYKTRLDRLKFELQESINHLDDESEFFIIFFNHESIPMPAESLQLATKETRKKYLHWANNIEADGLTDPRRALRLALRLKPEVIYFLTDGSINDTKIKRDLKKIKQNRSVIHTIAFGNKGAEPLLRKIAKHNKGRFYFVP
jgi:von Willebrand factor type A domain